MQKWEYKFHKLQSTKLDAPINTRSIQSGDDGEHEDVGVVDDLNAYGDEGWEVTHVFPDGVHILMKRPVQPPKTSVLDKPAAK
jgi:hypothetical protein